MPTEYEKAHARYRELAKAAANGDAAAKAEKAKVMNDIRAIEREAARAGTILSARQEKDRLVFSQTETRSKKSLQDEYVHRFDDSKQVEINGEKTTLRQYHKKRLKV